MKEGDSKVEKAVTELGKDVNGWRVSAAQGDRVFYNGNWLLRAAAAKAGIYGNDPPGKARESNWLPAPNDTIYLVMRLYWPKDAPPSILPPGDGSWKPPGVVRAS